MLKRKTFSAGRESLIETATRVKSKKSGIVKRKPSQLGASHSFLRLSQVSVEDPHLQLFIYQLHCLWVGAANHLAHF